MEIYTKQKYISICTQQRQYIDKKEKYVNNIFTTQVYVHLFTTKTSTWQF